MFCLQFRDRIYQTVRNLADPDQILAIQEATGIPPDRIIKTKCGYICQALDVLMNFRNKRRHPLNVPLSSFYGYMFDFEGLDPDGQNTTTDHELIFLYDQGWWMIDSYLGCRELTCRRIEPDQILKASKYLRHQFNEELWVWLTGCHSTDSPGAPTTHMRVVVTEFEYTPI